jgi:ketosteroid isomerase-like protein
MINNPSVDAESSVRDWLASWEVFIRGRDFEQARQLFAPGVLGFGSVATVARSIDELEGAQWRRVWPSLGSFAFEDEHLTIFVSDDGLLAAVGATWSSTWIADESGRARPGRASIVLMRDAADGQWRAVHTHFSLNPG